MYYKKEFVHQVGKKDRYYILTCRVCVPCTAQTDNDTHIGTRYVILVSTVHSSLMMVLCEPKHVGADFIILTILIV